MNLKKLLSLSWLFAIGLSVLLTLVYIALHKSPASHVLFLWVSLSIYFSFLFFSLGLLFYLFEDLINKLMLRMKRSK